LFCLALPAAAATLDEYQKRVEAAAIDADTLADEGKRDAATVAEIRRLVPATEKVDRPGGSLDTDNQWLQTALDEFSAETDAAKRRARMAAISERLQAISEKIDELKKAETAERTKDEDKQKLAEILHRPEYQKPEAQEESLFQKWYRKFMEWLRSVFPKAPESSTTPSGFGSLKFILQIAVYLLVIGLIAFVLYKCGPLVARRFGWRRKEKKRDRVILGERIGADETAENLFGEAERLAREGRLRDAIRKGYIAALCELADRKIVRLARHKTNRDYLRDVRKTREGIFDNMSGLTGMYERNWYGLRVSDLTDWEDFRERYRQTIASV
jgi:hypothetical protein